MNLAILNEIKPSGMFGGSTMAGTWNKRELNNNVPTGNNWCTLNPITNEFILKAGKYSVTANAVGVGVGSHELRLRNINDNVIYNGLSSFSDPLAPNNSSTTTLSVYVNIPVQKTFLLEHYTEKAVVNYGKGFPVKVQGTDEIYANVVIQKI